MGGWGGVTSHLTSKLADSMVAVGFSRFAAVDVIRKDLLVECWSVIIKLSIVTWQMTQ